ncbi:murein hydrolase activator EnvC family protein [Amedibacillus sp. YH-ame6]
MKKIKKITMILLLATFTLVPTSPVYAEDFEGNEDYWNNKCKVAQDTAEEKNQCEAFRQYYIQKRESLSNDLASISDQVKSLQTNIENASKVVKDLNSTLDFYTKSIEVNDANIRTISAQIEELKVNIAGKEKEIDVRYNRIKDRMISEQSQLGTNVNVEIIMGSDDLVDMIRKVDGLQKITESDKEEINTFQKEKEKLDLDKGEQERLKSEVEIKREENVQNKEIVETLKTEQLNLIATYQKQEAALAEKMRSVQVDINSIRNNIISITNPGDLDFSGNTGLAMPVQGGYISAGTWYYPGGGAHLGMDKAVPIGTPVIAPSDGIILYASAPVSSNGGYLGNWSGYPQGGGNTMQLLTQANGITYAISFFHLSQGGMLSAGTRVSVGQQIALTGNSGNSSGAHCHIEVINLGNMSLTDAIARFQRTADFAWGNGWGSGAVNNVCNIKGAPCRMRPEEVF